MADALSRKTMGSLAHLEAYQRPLAKGIHWLASLGVRLVDSSEGGEWIHKHKTMAISLGIDDGTVRYQGRLCVPNVDGPRERNLSEAHTSRYSVHLSSTKMYHDLREVYWLNDMKRNIADIVARCPNCQQVKAEHQRLGGLA
ncbi:uncharacterized protein [Nicotiana tomentosiformis]|uniref:uncharacterized protein n=1 Tax=Nicotiana tomentosiformis TaxID=4098 RepID=UPI00388C4436